MRTKRTKPTTGFLSAAEHYDEAARLLWQWDEAVQADEMDPADDARWMQCLFAAQVHAQLAAIGPRP